ncbi:2-keto-4-pentenoate hydratase [Georgenia yuyongxinii]|uniref:2-keto-4-pentenoate hydratase n=1 Tax=Georgenia yuyongxinii TaxID=2589797 RepID=A0A552WWD3_9MICO|nr:fumarylacetoacetate hydrolase family protein [Georgenia yuyongxinii]TRW47035.1 2-keto-4-pentenoate hydratase [Georgenia yuyongxinii]
MTADDAVGAAVERLVRAAATRQACAPVRDLIGSSDLAAAYAVQDAIAARRTAEGAVVVGRKIGLTSPAVQEQLGVDQPDFGILFEDTQYADGETVPYSRLLQPRAEAEVAFVLKEDLTEGDLGLDRVAAAVDYAVAAIEVADSRVAGWDITFADTVADNASSGVYVLGNERKTLDEFTPRDVGMTMTVTGQEVSTGSGAACLGDPLVAVQWLARKARDLGQPLRAGQVILSGALGPMRAVAPGATATATITALGSVTLHFTEG